MMVLPVAERVLSSTEVVDLTGLSYRRLDYWVRNGVLGDPERWTTGQGTARRFTSSEAWVLGVLRRLSSVADQPSIWPSTVVLGEAARLLTAAGEGCQGYLAVSGDRAVLVSSAGELVALLDGSGVGWAVVALDDPMGL